MDLLSVSSQFLVSFASSLWSTMGSLSPGALLALFAIYAFSALMSGFSGFGFSAIGAVSFAVIDPLSAVSVLICLSVISQFSSISLIWSEMRAARPSPFHPLQGILPSLIGALLGVPLGVYVLQHADGRALMLGLGLALPAYAAWAALSRFRVDPAMDRPSVSILVGACGGVVGGICGFPGSAMVIWNGLLGRGKEGRAFTQGFVLATQCIALVWLAAGGNLGETAIILTALFAPVVLVANALGVRCYCSASVMTYKRWTLVALAISGLALIGKAVFLD